MLKRTYEVHGCDDGDDVHTYRTDDRERAEEILATMREDLEDAELIEVTD
jgi:hypothetical protein